MIRCVSGLVVVAAAALLLRSGGAGAACGSNVVACENQLPGVAASAWLPGGSGDATIQGFSTDISVDHGQTTGFKVKTAASAYRIDRDLLLHARPLDVVFAP